MNTLKNYDFQISQLLSKMTLEQKIGQLNQIKYDNSNEDAVADQIKRGSVGSLILAGSAWAGNDRQHRLDCRGTNRLQQLAMENGGIPLIIGRDVIHGHRTVYPVPLAMAATFSPNLIRKSYREIAEEAASDGVHWTFAPMADISRDSRWGRCIEGPGEDPCLGSAMAEAAIAGLQGEEWSAPSSLAACVKHFIGYGASEGGRDYEATEIGEITLRNYYLQAFQAAADAGVATVMSSFNAISGEPVSSNGHLMREILKEEFGFEGFILADWNAVQRMIGFGVAQSRKECAEMCLKAGLDMDMVSGCYADHLKELIEEGSISIAMLDDAVRRVLRIKFAFGLFDHPYTEPVQVDYDKHLQTAIKVSEESIVLLKNENAILPLKENDRIAAVGPMLEAKRDLLGSWTLDFDIARVKSIKEVLTEEYGDKTILFPESIMQDAMLLCARKANVTVAFLGEPAMVTGEANSVADISIQEDQAALIRALHGIGQKIVAVLCYGRPRAIQNIEPYCDAILYAWHGGTGAAQAIAHTLMGESVPSGALPMTLPRHSGQIPIYYNAPRCGSRVEAYYDSWMNCYHDIDRKPMYPFGFGLSYTTFEYTNIRLENKADYEEIMKGHPITVSIDVTNSGPYDASEIVQCYVKDELAQISRPLRELKGFQKVYLRAGETKTVRFCLGRRELGYWNRDNRYVVEPGKFTIFVGKGAYAQNKLEAEVM